MLHWHSLASLPHPSSLSLSLVASLLVSMLFSVSVFPCGYPCLPVYVSLLSPLTLTLVLRGSATHSLLSWVADTVLAALQKDLQQHQRQAFS